jgi:hypothetical protein
LNFKLFGQGFFSKPKLKTKTKSIKKKFSPKIGVLEEQLGCALWRTVITSAVRLTQSMRQ